MVSSSLVTRIFSFLALSAAGPIVNLSDGDVEGIVEGSVAAWRGIPFAAPPVGDNRWRPPQPVVAWRPRLLRAVTNKPECPQFQAYGYYGMNLTNNSSEDCLYLNVWAPFPLPKIKVSVLAWVHGGAFVGGSAINAMYDGAALVNASRDHIVVTLAYRLGVLGFAASDLLRSRDPEGSTGNYGVQDQRQALTWIRDNIANFGGDASRVLLFGESAGGASVSHHLVRQKSWGLFHAAAIESGSFLVLGGRSTVAAQNQAFLSLMDEVQCRSVKCLLECPFVELMRAQTSQNPGWLPSVDGVDLAQPYAILAEHGHLARVPVLLGTNHEDAEALMPTCEPASCTEADFQTWAKRLFGPGGWTQYSMTEAELDRLTMLYSNESGNTTPTATKWYWAIKRAGAHHFNSCPARRLAKWVTESGQNAFWFQFTATSKSLVKDGFEGVNDSHYFSDACEGCEMPYLFGHRLAQSERKLSGIIQKYWLSFAATGVPIGREAWPSYNVWDEPALVLGAEVHIQHHPLQEKCNFWDLFFSKDWPSMSPGFFVMYT